MHKTLQKISSECYLVLIFLSMRLFANLTFIYLIEKNFHGISLIQKKGSVVFFYFKMKLFHKVFFVFHKPSVKTKSVRSVL